MAKKSHCCSHKISFFSIFALLLIIILHHAPQKSRIQKKRNTRFKSKTAIRQIEKVETLNKKIETQAYYFNNDSIPLSKIENELDIILAQARQHGIQELIDWPTIQELREKIQRKQAFNT